MTISLKSPRVVNRSSRNLVISLQLLQCIKNGLGKWWEVRTFQELPENGRRDGRKRCKESIAFEDAQINGPEAESEPTEIHELCEYEIT